MSLPFYDLLGVDNSCGLFLSTVFKNYGKGARSSGPVRGRQYPLVKRLTEAERKRILVSSVLVVIERHGIGK